jgi:imidazolonepropionase-like amidohydrolase
MTKTKAALLAAAAVVAGLFAGAACAQPYPAPNPLAETKGQQPLIIKGGWLFTATSDQVVKNGGILVVGGKIVAMNRPFTPLESAGAKVVTLRDDEYMLPGLIDVHAHYNLAIGPKAIRADEMDVNPVVFLANGVTATFPAAEYEPDDMVALRRRIDSGKQPGPRILNSGPYFGSARVGWNKASTPEDIYREVDEWADKGARGFKAKGATTQQLRALIERAHMHGLPVTGHLGSNDANGVNARDAVMLGIDRVEHILGGDVLDPAKGAYDSWVKVDVKSKAFKDIVALFISHKVTFDPTLTAPGYFTPAGTFPGFDYWVDENQFFTPEAQAWLKAPKPQRAGGGGGGGGIMKSLYETMQVTTKAFYDAGGTISLGTDVPGNSAFLAGFAAHRELDAMVLAGIPPAAALKAGTINGARTMGMGDRLGSIEVGKFADMFVITGNPLKEIKNTRTVHTVIKSGQVYETKALLDSVVGKIPMSKQRAN